MIPAEYDIAVAKLRSKIYSLLADGFRQVDEKQFKRLTSEYILTWQELLELIEDGEEFFQLIERLEKTLTSLNYTGLFDEYAQLFESQGKLIATPYESVYTMETPQHGLTQQAQLADIAGFYKAFGLEISEERPDRVDHITTELEFMHVLAYKESVALQNNEKEHVEIVQDAQRSFMNDHLGRWAGKFRERLNQIGDGTFYGVLAEVLELWVSLDRNYLLSGDEREKASTE